MVTISVLTWKRGWYGFIPEAQSYDTVFSRPLHQPHHLWRHFWWSCILFNTSMYVRFHNASALTQYSLWRHIASDILVNLSSGSLLSVRRQAIVSSNVYLFSTRFYGTYFNNIQLDCEKFSLKKMNLIILSARLSFCSRCIVFTSRVCFSSLCRRDDGPMGNYYCMLAFRMINF